MDLCWIRYTAKPTYNHHFPTSLYEGGHQHTNVRKMFSKTKYIQIYLTKLKKIRSLEKTSKTC